MIDVFNSHTTQINVAGIKRDVNEEFSVEKNAETKNLLREGYIKKV